MNIDQVKTAFNAFDLNNDGKITTEEYVKACRQNGNASPESTLREAFKLFDLDNDGSIDFNEFASAMKFLGSVK